MTLKGDECNLPDAPFHILQQCYKELKLPLSQADF